MQTPQWEEQYSLVVRWYVRVVVCAENPYESDVTLLKDYLYAFFMSCWHLKDWLIADPTVKISNSLINKFVNKSEGAIKICGDIATRAKHLEVSDPRRDRTASLDIGMVHITVNKIDGGSETTLRTTTNVSSIHGTTDALEVAKKSLEEWEQFLIKHKLKGYGGLMKRARDQINEELADLSSSSNI